MRILPINKHSFVAGMGLVALVVGLAMPVTASAASQVGIDPNHPIAVSIVPGQDVTETGTLAPGQQVWYSIKVNDVNGRYAKTDNDQDRASENQEGIQDQPPLDLSLFATPGNGNSIDHVQMDLFSGKYAQEWSQGQIWVPGMKTDVSDRPNVAPFGAGSVVTNSDKSDKNTGDPNVGELTYSGNVISGETVLVLLQNNNPYPVSYHLYTANMTNVQF
jgi:hypothetical protein